MQQLITIQLQLLQLLGMGISGEQIKLKDVFAFV
jgi:hypothetical protein